MSRDLAGSFADFGPGVVVSESAPTVQGPTILLVLGFQTLIGQPFQLV